MFKFFAILCNKNLLTELSIGDHIRLAHIPRESLVQTKIATKFQDFANVAKFSCAGNSGLNTASLKVQNILNSNRAIYSIFLLMFYCRHDVRSLVYQCL